MKRYLLFISIIIFLFSLSYDAAAQSNQTVATGSSTTAINFPASQFCVYNWVNSAPGIGLAASGAGNIPSFTAVNNGFSPVTATITATPASLGFAYIANAMSNDVSVVNTGTNTVVTTIPVGSYPFGAGASPDGSRVYVANASSNNVSVINTTTNTVIATITIGGSPNAACVSPDGKTVYVSCTNGIVYVIDAASNFVTSSITVGTFPACPAITPDGTRLYVPNGGDNTVSVIDALTNTVLTTINVGNFPQLAVVSPDGLTLYVSNANDNTVWVISTATNATVAIIPVGKSPQSVSISPNGSTVYVANQMSNSVSVINTATNTVTATVAVGKNPDCTWVTADGSAVYVPNQNSNDVSVINTATNTVITTITVGKHPVSTSHFLIGGIGCSASPVTFTITVTPPLSPTIRPGAVTGVVAACAGTASASPYLQQFPVSGVSLTGSITATAPKDFEVSLATGSGFGTSITISPTGGIINTVVVYVRAAASAPVGNISGNVILSSPGATNQQLPVNGVVNALPTVNAVGNQTLPNGSPTNAISFTGTANNIYSWVNNTPGIGLAANGSGNIPSFTAVNTGSSPVTATITVTPVPVGNAYIANNNSGSVSVINTATNTLLTTVNVGSAPTGVVVSQDGSRVYVTNQNSNNVSVINTTTNSVISTIPAGATPYGIAISPDGSLIYVANYYANSVSVINTATNVLIATINVGASPDGICISPDGTGVYVANFYTNNVSVINTATNAVVATIFVGSFPNGITISPDGKTVYVANQNSNDISVINTATNAVAATIPVGSGPSGIAISPNGAALYVANEGSNTVSVINTSTNAVTSTIMVGSGPDGLSVSPDGSQVYATNSTSGNVSVINTTTNLVTTTVGVGGLPISQGNFISKGTGCIGTPVTFTITVTPTSAAAITTTGIPAALKTVYGTPSASAAFNVSGTKMTTGILVTPPAGFEVSTDNINFTATVTVGAAGTIALTQVYVRLAATTPAGVYSGNIILTSTGATSQTVTVTGTVTPAPLTIAAAGVSKTYGTAITGNTGSAAFTSTGLQNSETIGSVTMAYGTGSAATDVAGIYAGSATPSAATGGTFAAGNYTITYLPGDITVTAVALTITANNQSKVFGAANPALTVSYNGFVNGDTPALLTALPIATTTATTTSVPGQYPITASGAASPDYTFIYIPGVLTINAAISLVIPNAFTPNGDGINDTWNIKNLDTYPNCTVEIYNRYGENVYSSIGYGLAWDGTYKGAMLPTSTYYYIINLKDGSKVLSGFVAIVR